MSCFNFLSKFLPQMTIHLAIRGVLIILVIFCVKSYCRKRDDPKLPPGPKPLPLIGNLLDLPPGGGEPEFRHWLKFKDKYGPISSVTILGRTIIIIHGRDAVNYILGTMARKTASKPLMEFAHKLCGFEDILAFQQYNSSYCQRRKLVNDFIGTKTMANQYQNVIEAEGQKLLLNLLNTPKHLIDHLKVYVCSHYIGNTSRLSRMADQLL
jgi:fumagillin biosynthesis cytochrome P450 monooxygenase